MGTYIRKKMTHLSANILIVDDEQSIADLIEVVDADLKRQKADGIA